MEQKNKPTNKFCIAAVKLSTWAQMLFKMSSESGLTTTLSAFPPTPPHHVKQALAQILDYLWDDELKDARRVLSESPDSYIGDHIFLCLVDIRAWLEARHLPYDMFFDDIHQSK